MNKIEARKKYLDLRKKLDNVQILSKSVSISNNLLDLPLWEHNFYHIYLPIKEKNEVDTMPIINILNSKKKKVLIPKSDFNNTTMKSFLLNDNTILKKNNYGITEPINNQEFLGRIDVIFIPLVAYDLIGNRVGYGKGFYDKFLRNQNNKILRVGLSFFNPEKRIKIDQHDENLDFCVTPNRIFSF
tara:strand:+ start:512 stop:1069 length:558 start_codon:yes stop_codon:yes gene_type:complete